MRPIVFTAAVFIQPMHCFVGPSLGWRRTPRTTRQQLADNSYSYVNDARTVVTKPSIIDQSEAAAAVSRQQERVDLDSDRAQAYQRQLQTVVAISNVDNNDNDDTAPISLSSSKITTTTEIAATNDYRRGLLTIGFCTLVFASMTPVMHAALDGAQAPPVLLLNAAVSVIAYLFLGLAGPLLEQMIPLPSSLVGPEKQVATITPAVMKSAFSKDWFGSQTTTTTTSSTALRAGLELGLWKFLGTTANLYGLSYTTSDHGAFLIQLTTLIVPVVQGLQGVPIPQRIQTSVALALAGVALFTQDHGSYVAAAAAAEATTTLSSSPSLLLGDALCVLAACFYATYDLRLFGWGKQVAPRELITNKIATQAALSVGLLLAAPGAWLQAQEFVTSRSSSGILSDSGTLLALIAWSGIMVNAIVPFLQVGGQQAIGPTRSQTIYASQPLWASIMSFFFLGETVGVAGLVGGSAFLSALFLAATAKAPDPNCEAELCEV